jgi:hypothetical protein
MNCSYHTQFEVSAAEKINWFNELRYCVVRFALRCTYYVPPKCWDPHSKELKSSICNRWNSILDRTNEYYKHCLYDRDNGNLQLPWTTPFCLSVLTQFLKKKFFYEVGGNPGCLFLCLSSMDSRIKQKNLDTICIHNENKHTIQIIHGHTERQCKALSSSHKCH